VLEISRYIFPIQVDLDDDESCSLVLLFERTAEELQFYWSHMAKFSSVC
jgi:hypothetical protein